MRTEAAFPRIVVGYPHRLHDAVRCERAVHFCFGNYGGQTIQKGAWKPLLNFLNSLHVDHLALELAHRPSSDLNALRHIDPKIALGIGVIDIKVNHVETPDEIAARIERAEEVVGDGRVRWVHPDCGFWMLKRSVADRKIEALVAGRDKYLGHWSVRTGLYQSARRRGWGRAFALFDVRSWFLNWWRHEQSCLPSETVQIFHLARMARSTTSS